MATRRAAVSDKALDTLRDAGIVALRESPLDQLQRDLEAKARRGAGIADQQVYRVLERLPAQWLVHFVVDGDDVANIVAQGFHGTPEVANLALTAGSRFHRKESGLPGWNFAFPLKDRGVVDRIWQSGAYGYHAVVFRAPALRVWHNVDKQAQTIFWGPDAKSRIAVYEVGIKAGVEVRDPQTGRPLRRGPLRKVLAWAVRNARRTAEARGSFQVGMGNPGQHMAPDAAGMVTEGAVPERPRRDFLAYVRVKSKADIRVAMRRAFTTTREFGLEAFDPENVWSKQSLDQLHALTPGLYKTRIGFSARRIVGSPVVAADLKKINATQEIDRLRRSMKKRKGSFRTRAPGVHGELERASRVQRLQDTNREMTEFLVKWLQQNESVEERGTFQVGTANAGQRFAPDALSTHDTGDYGAADASNVAPEGDPNRPPRLTKKQRLHRRMRAAYPMNVPAVDEALPASTVRGFTQAQLRPVVDASPPWLTVYLYTPRRVVEKAGADPARFRATYDTDDVTRQLRLDPDRWYQIGNIQLTSGKWAAPDYVVLAVEVAKEFQGRGVGRYLYALAFDAARKRRRAVHSERPSAEAQRAWRSQTLAKAGYHVEPLTGQLGEPTTMAQAKEFRFQGGTREEIEEARLRFTKRMLQSASGMGAQMIVAMDPQRFLDVTTPDRQQRDIIQQMAKSPEQYNQWAQAGETTTPPFLRIRVEKGTAKIAAHEGRHRAAALIQSGATKMLVALHLRGDEDFHRQVAPDDPRDAPYRIRFAHVPDRMAGEFSGASALRKADLRLVREVRRKLGFLRQEASQDDDTVSTLIEAEYVPQHQPRLKGRPWVLAGPAGDFLRQHGKLLKFDSEAVAAAYRDSADGRRLIQSLFKQQAARVAKRGSLPEWTLKKLPLDPGQDRPDYAVIVGGKQIGTVGMTWRRLGGWGWASSASGYVETHTERNRDSAVRRFVEWWHKKQESRYPESFPQIKSYVPGPAAEGIDKRKNARHVQGDTVTFGEPATWKPGWNAEQDPRAKRGKPGNEPVTFSIPEATARLKLMTVKEHGKTFKTGTPVAFPFLRNTEPAPPMGARFGQDIEPAGRYLTHRDPGATPPTPTWKMGTVRFTHPWVLEWGTTSGAAHGWKARLSQHYAGKTGKALAQAIRADGYDGIVTVGTMGGARTTMEIVDLTGIQEADDTVSTLHDTDADDVPYGEAPAFPYRSGEGGTEAITVRQRVKPGMTVVIDGQEVQVTSVRRQWRTVRLPHPTDPKGPTQTPKRMVVTVRGYVRRGPRPAERSSLSATFYNRKPEYALPRPQWGRRRPLGGFTTESLDEAAGARWKRRDAGRQYTYRPLWIDGQQQHGVFITRKGRGPRNWSLDVYASPEPFVEFMKAAGNETEITSWHASFASLAEAKQSVDAGHFDRWRTYGGDYVSVAEAVDEAAPEYVRVTFRQPRRTQWAQVRKRTPQLVAYLILNKQADPVRPRTLTPAQRAEMRAKATQAGIPTSEVEVRWIHVATPREVVKEEPAYLSKKYATLEVGEPPVDEARRGKRKPGLQFPRRPKRGLLGRGRRRGGIGGSGGGRRKRLLWRFQVGQQVRVTYKQADYLGTVLAVQRQKDGDVVYTVNLTQPVVYDRARTTVLPVRGSRFAWQNVDDMRLAEAMAEGAFALGFSPGHVGRDEFLRDPFLALYGDYNAPGAGTFSKATGKKGRFTPQPAEPVPGQPGKTYQPGGEPHFKTATGLAVPEASAGGSGSGSDPTTRHDFDAQHPYVDGGEPGDDEAEPAMAIPPNLWPYLILKEPPEMSAFKQVFAKMRRQPPADAPAPPTTASPPSGWIRVIPDPDVPPSHAKFLAKMFQLKRTPPFLKEDDYPRPNAQGVYAVPTKLWPLLHQVRRNGQSVARTRAGETVPVEPVEGLPHDQCVQAAQFFQLREAVFEAHVNGRGCVFTHVGIDALWNAKDPTFRINRKEWEADFFTPVLAEVDTSMARQDPMGATAQAITGLAGVVNQCGHDGVCYYHPEQQRATLVLPPEAKGRAPNTDLLRQLLAVPHVTSAAVKFDTPMYRPGQAAVDQGYRQRTRRYPPLLPATHGDLPVRLGAWVAGYDESLGFQVVPEQVQNPVDHLAGERHNRRLARVLTRGRARDIWQWWQRGRGYPTNEAADLIEAKVTLDDLRQYLVPRKSVVMGNAWWTVVQRDLKQGKVAFVKADWEKGPKGQPRITTLDTILKNVNSGAWGMSILNKGHIGKDSPRFTGNKNGPKESGAPRRTAQLREAIFRRMHAGMHYEDARRLVLLAEARKRTPRIYFEQYGGVWSTDADGFRRLYAEAVKGQGYELGREPGIKALKGDPPRPRGTYWSGGRLASADPDVLVFHPLDWSPADWKAAMRKVQAHLREDAEPVILRALLPACGADAFDVTFAALDAATSGWGGATPRADGTWAWWTEAAPAEIDTIRATVEAVGGVNLTPPHPIPVYVPDTVSTPDAELNEGIVQLVRKYLDGNHQVIHLGTLGWFDTYVVQELGGGGPQAGLERNLRDRGIDPKKHWKTIHTHKDYTASRKKLWDEPSIFLPDATAGSDFPNVRKAIETATGKLQRLGLPRQRRVLVLTDLRAERNPLTGGGVAGYAHKQQHGIEVDLTWILKQPKLLLHEFAHHVWFQLPADARRYFTDWYTQNVIGPTAKALKRRMDDADKRAVLALVWDEMEREQRQRQGHTADHAAALLHRYPESVLTDAAHHRAFSQEAINLLDQQRTTAEPIILVGTLLRGVSTALGPIRKGQKVRVYGDPTRSVDLAYVEPVKGKARTAEVALSDLRSRLEVDLRATDRENKHARVSGLWDAVVATSAVSIRRSVESSFDGAQGAIYTERGMQILRNHGYDTPRSLFPEAARKGALVALDAAIPRGEKPSEAWTAYWLRHADWHNQSAAAPEAVAARISTKEGNDLKQLAQRVGGLPSTYAASNAAELWAEILAYAAERKISKGLQKVLRDVMQGKYPTGPARVKGPRGGTFKPRHEAVTEEIHRANPFPAGSDGYYLYHELCQALRKGAVAATRAAMAQYVDSEFAVNPFAKHFTAKDAVLTRLQREGVIAAVTEAILGEAVTGAYTVVQAFQAHGRPFRVGDRLRVTSHVGGKVTVHHTSLAKDYGTLTIPDTEWAEWQAKGYVQRRTIRTYPYDLTLRRRLRRKPKEEPADAEPPPEDGGMEPPPPNGNGTGNGMEPPSNGQSAPPMAGSGGFGPGVPKEAVDRVSIPEDFASTFKVKGKWKSITPADLRRDPALLDELFTLLTQAYAKIGGHANLKLPKDFLGGELDLIRAVDVDTDPQADAFTAYKRRPAGLKSVAAGSDATPAGKRALVTQKAKEFGQRGYYAEVSGAVAHIMLTRHPVPSIQSQKAVERILGKPVEWVGAHPDGKYPKHPGWYRRTIGGTKHLKILVGRPLGEAVDEAFDYAGMGTTAPAGVRREIAHFRKKPEAERRAQPLLYFLLGRGTPAYKMEPADTGYVDRSAVEGQRCGNCEFAYKKMSDQTFICSQIRGRIQLAGWCNQWVPAEA